MARASDILDVHDMARLLKLPDYENVEDELPNVGEDELHQRYHQAVTFTAAELFGQCGLKFEPTSKARRSAYPWEYKVVPEVDWNDAAAKIRDVINGIGYFRFERLSDFIRSYPSARESVLKHLHWVKDVPEVYGGPSASELYERAFYPW